MFALAALLLIAPAAHGQAAPPPYTIEAGTKGARAIGPLDVSGGADPTVGDAIAAFGQPTKLGSDVQNGCDGRWDAIGLSIAFANFGEPGASTCAADIGKVQLVTMRGPSWRTSRGLAGGDPRSKLLALYKGARRNGANYSIFTRPSRFGRPGTKETILSALVRNGRVASFSLRVGAAGE